MSDLLIHNAQIITPSGVLEHGWLYASQGRIAAMGQGQAPDYPEARAIDAGGLTLTPGFIDVHVHGAVGADTMDGDVESLRKMAQFYAQHGVTSFLPTTLTASREQLLAALNAVKRVQGMVEHGATILGAHLEGPYLNLEKSGAQNTEHIRRAGRDEALELLNVEVIRQVSLAPEFEENHWLIRECVKRGITVSMAHTDATYEQACYGIELGITHATHTYNAMTGLHHRNPGVLGAVLGSDRVRCELISDTIHVHPGAMNVVWKAKGVDHVILITDAMSATGMPDGDYKLGDYPVTVRDKTARLANGALAGSVLTYEEGIRNFMRATNTTLSQIWQVFSLNPARSSSVSNCKGSLEINKDADFVLVDQDVNVYYTVIMGQVVFEQKEHHIKH